MIKSGFDKLFNFYILKERGGGRLKKADIVIAKIINENNKDLKLFLHLY